MKTAPYTIFGKTKEYPIEIRYPKGAIEDGTWDETLWIEIPEDWYALSCTELKNKKVRIVRRDIWITL